MLANVRLVLMRPRNSENLGAAARAMKNFGLTDWAWVEAYAQDDEDARRLAVNAGDTLSAASQPATLAEAVSDCSWVVGTSCRRSTGKRSLSPRAWAEEAFRRGVTGRVALVFGDERSGLRAHEIDACHDLSIIPTDAHQPSVNLAQSVLLYAYELSQAARSRGSMSPPPRAAPATDASLRALEEELRSALRARGFLVGGDRHAPGDLFDCLRRAQLSAREFALWRTALRVLGHGRRSTGSR